MTGSEIMGLAGVLIVGAVLVVCAVVGATQLLNDLAYWWENRHGSDVVDRASRYTVSGRPEPHDDVRARSRWS